MSDLMTAVGSIYSESNNTVTGEKLNATLISGQNLK